MEIFVETLTGTLFELRVSPFETVISVKAKIQRLEGIPIGQQHLIWKSIELEDDYCLSDYGITDGCTLKLVLAMRGGPINTRRVPMEDPAIQEMAEYMEANKEEIWERFPGNRQVTLLVFREGDQLNFFRVVDRGDGTLTPLSESLSGASMYNMYEEEEEEVPSKEQVEENDLTNNKMKLLRAKMEMLAINKKMKQRQPKPPSSGHPKSHSRRKLVATKTTAGGQTLIKNCPLPPVKGTAPHPPHRGEKAAGGGGESCLSEQLSPPLGLGEAGPAQVELACGLRLSAIRRHLERERPHSGGKRAGRASPPPASPPAAHHHHHHHHHHHKPAVEVGSSAKFGRSHTVLGPGVSLATGSGGPRSLNRVSGGKLGGEAPSASAAAAAAAAKRAAASEYAEIMSLGPPDARMVTDLVNKASKERKITELVRSSTKDSIGRASGRSRVMSGTISLAQALNSGSSRHNSGSGERVATPEGRKSLISAHSIRRRLSANRDNRIVSSPTHRLPPVKSTLRPTKKKAATKRCFLCGKKTGLATSYQCRCGNNFCATHRYAELHKCEFDYKAAGRKLLEQSNPVVSAPKLPKI